MGPLPRPGWVGVTGRGLFDSDSIDPAFFDVLKALHHTDAGTHTTKFETIVVVV